MAKKKAKPKSEFPYVVQDPAALIRNDHFGKWLVLGPTALGSVRAIGRQIHLEGVTMGVVHATLSEQAMKSHYTPVEISSLQSFIGGLKEMMLVHGATPMAVEWMGELSPFSEKELSTMAEKLTKKAAPKKAAPKKSTAKGGKGNPEALEKARAARAEAAQADRKYKPLTKIKDVKTREGTWTEYMLDIILGNKSTTAAKEAHAATKQYEDKRLDFNWAEKKGFIEFA